MSTAKRFRKKPVEIEAVQLVDDFANHLDVADWIARHGGQVEIPKVDPWLYIVTLEGKMRADIGDYVIKGVQGEFYPCKPDIFEQTYDAV